MEEFSGVFGIGSQGNGDTYHLEVHDGGGRRQVLHLDHETAAFSGVFADSLDSLVYLAALVKVGDSRAISPDAYAAGLRKLRGKVAPTWQFSILPCRPHHCRATPTLVVPFLANAEGSNTSTPSGSPRSSPTCGNSPIRSAP